MSKNSGVLAVGVFLFVLAFPFIYNAVSGGASAEPKLKITKEGDCIRETAWMRHNHMKLLMHTRDDVVRSGIRKAKHGIQGCRSCHESRGEFCDKCHEYVGVQPECWTCHNYPT